jgi:molybdate transport system substrate-binding protein
MLLWAVTCVPGLGNAARAADEPTRELRVAVAANFVATADRIARRFEASSGTRVLITAGATGHLFAQISQGAPFDVFLAADAARPARAVADGLAIADSQRSYAIGQLVLLASARSNVAALADLARPAVGRIAIANPRTAPYGAAAEAVLRKAGLEAAVRGKLVRGQNVMQALQFLVTGNVDAAFVARALVMDRPQATVIAIPSDAYPEIRQDAVIVKATRHRASARAFLDYLSSTVARDIIAASGYRLPPLPR